MKKIGKKAGADRSQRKTTDLVGIDFSTTATKVVRLKKTKDEVSLAGIDLLPAVDLGSPAQRLELPRNMVAHYGCLAYSGSASVMRMVNAPLAGEDTAVPMPSCASCSMSTTTTVCRPSWSRKGRVGRIQASWRRPSPPTMCAFF